MKVLLNSVAVKAWVYTR